MRTSSAPPELLAPAGNMERLKTALRFGADAVYVGAQRMSLRNFADNFSFAELCEACDTAHQSGAKVYVACNAFPRDDDLKDLPSLLMQAADAKADALIVNDPGVIRMARKIVPAMPLHLSTQANTLNSEAALFWHEQGISRIVLAREMTLQQIKALRENTPQTLELEMFVHGAMCISYSGRCLLSNYLDGRDSNRGECVQPCRWAYEMREKGSDGAYVTVEQDEKGSFVLNSRDLNLIRYLDRIIEAGVCSLKIEGRMKSVAYVATVTNAYRMALDAIESGETPPEYVYAELDKASHRPYWTGFALGNPGAQGQENQSAQYATDMDIAAVVLSYDEAEKRALVEQRNRFFDGDTLGILSPREVRRAFRVEGIWAEDGTPKQSAPHPKERLYVGCQIPVQSGDILRISK
ncbi:MAG: U32 family peptidase [Eubacteriales bacterium]|nr:U32 family peptidase [Eubacteriales bacterium]